MASLTGNQIKDTYEGLLKTTDNDVLGSSAKVITDGAGNASGLSLDTNGNVAVAADLSVGDELIVTGAASVGGTLTLDGALIDSNGSSGTGGQVLASTVTGTDWVSLSEISGVDGTGTADKIAKWSDADTIANSTITDNGSLVSFATPISVTGAVTSTGANTASSFVKTGGTSSQFLKADGSVDGTVYATEADLTTAEGRISVNEGDIVAIESKTNFITVTQAVNLDTMESDIAGVKTKTDFITVTQAVDLDDMEADIATNASDIATNASAITTKVSKSGDTMTGNLTATGFIKTGGTSTQFLKADGSVDSSTYLTAESDTLDAVTDRGASTTNSIAVGNVTATSFIKSGGTSAQFLKADGSIDSNAYITAESDTLDSVTDRGAVTTNTVTVGDFNAQASSLNSLSVVTTSSFTGDAAFDVDTLFVDVSADRVGVNTNAPTEALDVVGNIKASGTLAVSGNAAFDTNTLFVDAANNRVGLGTLFPSERLTVVGSVNISSGGLETYRTDGGAGLVVNGGDLGNSSYIARFKDFSNNDKVVIKGDGDISFRDSSANEAFYWDASAASLGIGIDAPTTKLYVKSSAFNVASFDSTFGQMAISFANNGTTFAQIGSGVSVTSTAAADDLGFGTAGLNKNIVFATGTGYTERMRIDSSGNVGIGTNTPLATLHAWEGSSGVSPRTDLGATIIAEGSTRAGLCILTSGTAAGSYGNIIWGNGNGNTEAYIYVYNDTRAMTFGTADTERMRIASNGDVLFGTTSASQSNSNSVAIKNINATSNPNAIQVSHLDGTDPGVQYLYFVYNGLAIGSITQNGYSGVAYNTSSDYRLKEDWVAMEGALDRVDALKPINFAWKADGSRVDGFLAHELAEVVPEAVTGEKDATEIRSVKVSDEVLDEEGNVITEAVYEEQEVPVYQGIDQSKIVPLLVAAIQELRAELNALKQA